MLQKWSGKKSIRMNQYLKFGLFRLYQKKKNHVDADELP